MVAVPQEGGSDGLMADRKWRRRSCYQLTTGAGPHFLFEQLSVRVWPRPLSSAATLSLPHCRPLTSGRMQLFILLLLSPVTVATALAGCHSDRDKDDRSRQDCSGGRFQDVPPGLDPSTKVGGGFPPTRRWDRVSVVAVVTVLTAASSSSCAGFAVS